MAPSNKKDKALDDMEPNEDNEKSIKGFTGENGGNSNTDNTTSNTEGEENKNTISDENSIENEGGNNEEIDENMEEDNEEGEGIKISDLAKEMGKDVEDVMKLIREYDIRVSNDGRVSEEDAEVIKALGGAGGEAADITYILSNLTEDSGIIADRKNNRIEVSIPGKGEFTLKYDEGILRTLTHALSERKAAKPVSNVRGTASRGRRKAEEEDEEEEEIPEEEEEEEKKPKTYLHGEIAREPSGMLTFSAAGSGKGPAGAGLPQKVSRRRGLNPEDILLAYYNTAETGKKILIEDLMRDTLFNQRLIYIVGRYVLMYVILAGAEFSAEEVQNLLKNVNAPEQIAALIISTIDKWRLDHIDLLNSDMNQLKEEINNLTSRINDLNAQINYLNADLLDKERKLEECNAYKSLVNSILTPSQAKTVFINMIAYSLNRGGRSA